MNTQSDDTATIASAMSEISLNDTAPSSSSTSSNNTTQESAKESTQEPAKEPPKELTKEQLEEIEKHSADADKFASRQVLTYLASLLEKTHPDLSKKMADTLPEAQQYGLPADDEYPNIILLVAFYVITKDTSTDINVRTEKLAKEMIALYARLKVYFMLYVSKILPKYPLYSELLSAFGADAITFKIIDDAGLKFALVGYEDGDNILSISAHYFNNKTNEFLVLKDAEAH